MATSKWDWGEIKKTAEPIKTTDTNTETPQEKTEESEKPILTSTSKIDDVSLWWKGLMACVTEKEITDIIFSPESHRVEIRVDKLLECYAKLTPESYNQVLKHTTTEEQLKELERKGEVDYAITLHARRMRVNIFKTLKGWAGAYRPLPNKTIPWKDNGLTDPVMRVIDTTKQGLVLVTGPTGSGKSTTICSMLQYINEIYPYHIITIEDPIEYIFSNSKATIQQREVGEHTESFQNALRASLRENPDIIFVGEIRDYETARTALMAADTGHLVFGTLHTRRVYATISRLLEMAPESSRPEMRAMLSSCLSMIICQRLVKKRGGGIYPCREIMMLNPAISGLIREGKEKGINNQLTINQDKGMVEWGKALETAEKRGLITKDEAEKYRDSTEDID